MDSKNIPINFKGIKASETPKKLKKHAFNVNKSKNRHISCIIRKLDEEDYLALRIDGFENEDIVMFNTLSNQIQNALI